MNHSHLRVDFDPHVNFIVGKNGSGKSAILNALIAGFGCKASSTGRNTNTAKSLIKSGACLAALGCCRSNTSCVGLASATWINGSLTWIVHPPPTSSAGCDHATISIHLANGGPDPYKPAEFGDTIVVETRFEKQGANSYKLRNGPDGAAKRAKKGDIDELCSHLNVQASNPCALLTQEHAKKFLHNGNEEDRYRFFLDAANMSSRKVGPQRPPIAAPIAASIMGAAPIARSVLQSPLLFPAPPSPSPGQWAQHTPPLSMPVPA